MFSKLRTAALSAVIGLGAIAAMPAAAQADGLYLNFGGSHRDAGVGIYVGGRDGAHYRHNRYDRRDYRACTPHRAVNKAERMGVRRARVVDEEVGHPELEPPPVRRPVTVDPQLAGRAGAAAVSRSSVVS